ncbi:MAG TPA: Gfo/Idh/MocA family oxidoreductase [Chthoniobacteraceae bacterium]|nr:Gfo/Idh/MocA family oxidoreductase [Chthoniobacteraceae bacterium]
MKLRFAFAGFRHGHIFSLLAAARENPSIEVVALCEEDEATRAQLVADGKLTPTHTSIAAMLAETECDVVAVGDYYGKRGRIVIDALKAGKHVISDKPLCTSLEELAEIEQLAREKNLQVGLQLDLRDAGSMIALRDVIASGEIGEVVTVNITGQHPLSLGVRPAWYFVPGAHGGTINDIGIHAFDIIPWLTGHPVEKVLAARSWNAKATEFPHFEDSAQLLARLTNGGGVLADFSYLAPTLCGFGEPNYWQITCHGLKGVASTNYNADQVRVVTDTDAAPRYLPKAEAAQSRYLADFLLCIEGRSDEAALTTESILSVTRQALEAQAAAVG